MLAMVYKQRDKIEAVFKEFDEAGSGTVSEEEFAMALELLGVDVSKAPIDGLTAQCTNNDTVSQLLLSLFFTSRFLLARASHLRVNYRPLFARFSHCHVCPKGQLRRFPAQGQARREAGPAAEDARVRSPSSLPTYRCL